jgi:hypothetical protein
VSGSLACYLHIRGPRLNKYHPSSGASHWHSDAAGASPQLYRRMKTAICGIPQRLDVSTATDDLDEITTIYGPFVDFWCIVIV